MSIFNNDKIEWFTYIYAPRFYDAYLVSGENYWYYKEDLRQGLGFWADAGGGWRMTGVMTSGGSPQNPVEVPLGVQLTWLSRTESKYYQARIHLPKEKILKLFSKEYKTDFSLNGKTGKMKAIQIALAPGGFISLRVGGARTVEVATFQAKEIDISWDFFSKTHHFDGNKLSEAEFKQDHYDTLPVDIKKQVDDNKFPLTRWREYSENRFPWYFATKMELSGCRIGCVNGEGRFYDKDDLKNIEKGQQAVPAWIMFFFKANDKRYVANIRFSKQRMGAGEKPDDDVSVYEEFQKFFTTNTLPTALVVEKEANGFEAYLTNGSKKQSLQIFNQEVWEAKKNQYPWF